MWFWGHRIIKDLIGIIKDLNTFQLQFTLRESNYYSGTAEFENSQYIFFINVSELLNNLKIQFSRNMEKTQVNLTRYAHMCTD